MSFTFSDSPIHKRFLCFVLAFIFCLFVLIFPFSLSASAASTDDFLLLTIATLDSWGISFSNASNDVDVLSLFETMFTDFLDVVGESASSFWSGAQVGIDKLGRILLDNTTAGRIYQFAKWLVDEYNLSNNSSVNTSNADLFYLNGLPVFLLPYVTPNLQGTGTIAVMNNTFSPAYVAFQYVSNNSTIVRAIVFAKTNQNFTYYISGLGNGQVANKSRNGWMYSDNYTASLTSYPWVDSSLVIAPDSSDFNAINTLFSSDYILSSSAPSLVIDTSIISIPEIAPDDGVVLTVPGADWGDTFGDILDLIESLIALYDSTQLDVLSIIESIANIVSALITPVSVDNIPGGIVMDYDNYDVPLDVVWDDVDSFYSSDYSGPIFLILKDLIFGLPSPLITFFSVTVIFVVAYGFIRMGRDSH